MVLRLSAPGNLLLCGEYAVLEEGGLGLGLAVEPRATLVFEPADRWEARFLFGDREWRWEGGEYPPLVAALAAEIGALPPARWVLDSRALHPPGRKLGLGSSAAACALICAAYLVLMEDTRPTEARVASLAVRVHRRLQGGRGSGYDVFTSVFGGGGLFQGGAEPTWEPRDLPWLEQPCLWTSSSPVSTPKAIEAFVKLRSRDSGLVAAYVAENNRLVSALARTRQLETALTLLGQLATLGREWGHRLGLTAEPPPDTPAAALVKALGAGGELFLVMQPREADHPGLLRLTRAMEGLRWD